MQNLLTRWRWIIKLTFIASVLWYWKQLWEGILENSSHPCHHQRPPHVHHHQVAEEVVLAVKLAFACLCVNPQSRPTMQQVCSSTLRTVATIVKTVFWDYCGWAAGSCHGVKLAEGHLLHLNFLSINYYCKSKKAYCYDIHEVDASNRG